jgi:hypothetical protein
MAKLAYKKRNASPPASDNNPKARRTQVKKVETKHDRFIRLANRRIFESGEMLRKVGQLASQNYEFSPQEAEIVIEKVQEFADGVIAKFKAAVPEVSGKKANAPVFAQY